MTFCRTKTKGIKQTPEKTQEINPGGKEIRMRKILILGLCPNFRILDQNGLVSIVSGCIFPLTSSYYKNSENDSPGFLQV